MRRRYTPLAFFFIIFLLLSGTLQATDFSIQRVSIASDGTQANDNSGFVYAGEGAAISAAGRYITFFSNANNLDPNNPRLGVFIYDVQTGVISRVNVSSLGLAGGNGGGHSPSISADGRFIAFDSNDNNLVNDDNNLQNDVFAHDMQTGNTTRISVSSLGSETDDVSGYASISADGHFVAFVSSATNLVSNDTNGRYDVFIHDMQTGSTKRISLSTSGTQGNNISGIIINGKGTEISINQDGRYVAFVSEASNLVANDTNVMSDVFIHDMETGETQIVSVSSLGVEGVYSSHNPTISADGHLVAFTSEANNLVPNDTNGSSDVFIHNMQTGNTHRVSVSSFGDQGNNGSGYISSISGDGRFIAFQSLASNLVSDDTNGTWDVFVHDTQTGETRRVSVSGFGAQASGQVPAISADGRFITFLSDSSNLVPNDTNGKYDVFRVPNVLWQPPPPSPPNAAPPRNYYTSLPLTLTWTSISWATGYQVQIATVNTFGASFIVSDTPITTNTPPLDIQTLDDGVYYWRVCARKTVTGCAPWSPVESFTVATS